jgi:hypothetical protein
MNGRRLFWRAHKDWYCEYFEETHPLEVVMLGKPRTKYGL